MALPLELRERGRITCAQNSFRLPLLCSLGRLRIIMQVATPKNIKRLGSPFIPCFFAAQLHLLPVFQWLVPVNGKLGCETSWFYLFATQKVRGKVHNIYNASSEMDHFHLWTGKRKETSQYRSMQRTLVCVYRHALMGWVRELLSTSIIPFTFDFPCSVEGLQSVTQNMWVSQISQPVL